MGEINIAPTATIDGLREKIKEKFAKALADYDAVVLTVTLHPPKSNPEPLPPNLKLEKLLKDHAELENGDEDGNRLVYVTVPPKPEKAAAAGRPHAAVLASEELEEQAPLDGANKYVHVHQALTAGLLEATSLVYVRKAIPIVGGLLKRCAKNTNIALYAPPGTGKSTTTWAWARWRALHHKQVVLWYHVDENRTTTKLILADNQIRHYESKGQLELDSSNAEIVIVDGVNARHLAQPYTCMY